jgi:hypothetical protein
MQKTALEPTVIIDYPYRLVDGNIQAPTGIFGKLPISTVFSEIFNHPVTYSLPYN